MRTLPFWSWRRLHGRRGWNRRAGDESLLYCEERIPWPVFLMAISLLVLSLIDGLFTFLLLDHGFEEANPLMRALLERGPVPFFVGKFLLTALFLPVVLILNRYRLFGSRVRVGHLIPVVLSLYLVLIAYQFHLWNHR